MTKQLRKIWLFTNKIFNHSQYCGLTLVESLVTVLLVSMFSGVLFALLLTGTDSWQTNSTQLELQQELRKSMVWISNDLRQAGSSSIIDVPADDTWYNTITFRIGAGVSGDNIVWSADTIQFLLAGADLKQLQRQSGMQNRIISHNIQSLQFRRQISTPNIVEIALVVQKTTAKKRLINLSSNFKVYLRN